MIHDYEVVQYADDIQFIHSGTTDELPDLVTRAESTLSLTKTYFNRNGLMINPNKTQCLFVGTRRFIRRIPSDTSISFGKGLITPSKRINYLGIYMYCHMIFDVHIQEMYKKVIGILNFLNRIKAKSEINTRKIIIVIQSLDVNIINCMAQLIVPHYGGCRNSTSMQQRYVLGELGGLITPPLLSHNSNGSKSRNKIIIELAVNVIKIKKASYILTASCNFRLTMKSYKLGIPHDNNLTCIYLTQILITVHARSESGI